MRLPHELQNEKINYNYTIDEPASDVVGGLLIPKRRITELKAVAEFSGETFVPCDDYEILRRIGRSATEGLAKSPTVSSDMLPQVWDISRSIAGVVREKFDWWSGLRAVSEAYGIEMADFMKPPLDVLRITPKDTPSVVFDFLNFGLGPFSDTEVQSAHNVFSRALRGVDLSKHVEGSRTILLVPSALAIIQMTDLVAYIDEDILKIFGQGGDSATLARYSDMVRSCFFSVGDDVDVTGVDDLDINVEVLPYEGEWGLKAPSEITFEVVEIS
jgi:hypothetical protein